MGFVFRSAFVGLVSLLALSGCATFKSKDPSSSLALEGDRKPVPQAKPIPIVIAGGETTRVTPTGEIFIHGVKLEHTEFDFPVTINSRVEYWINYFIGKGRPHFSRYLERSELFIPYIHPILRESQVPEDLVYLAMIESGFHNHARSSAKAVGPWQFMPFTGRRYGLMVNWWVDERRDTRKSTLAAVAYLKDLYSIFGSWELAAAAYNAGETKMARGIKRYGTDDFWVISKQQFLRPETRDYVPKIIAAAIVAKNRVQFGFSAIGEKPVQGEAVAGDGEIVKLESHQGASDEEERIKDEEKSLAESAQTPAEGDEETVANVVQDVQASDGDLSEPEERVTAAVLLTHPPSDQTGPKAKPIPTPTVNKKGELSGEEIVEFEVQGPADLLMIAKAAGLSYHTVKALNPEIIRWCTPPNVSTYRIKLPESVKDQFLTQYNQGSFPREIEFLAYKVRKGDTLSKVARKFGIGTEPVADLNGISPRRPLRHGTKVLLPMPSDQSRTIASLDVRDPPRRRRYRKRSKSRSSRSTYKVSQQKRREARANSAAKSVQ